MPQTLYLIRHTTPAIAPGICYGQLDLGLGDSFTEEAEHVLNWLPPVDLILTSPLARARKLAEYVGHARENEVRIDARLMEKHFGAWEGKPWDSIARDEVDAWAADLLGYAPPGGESAQQVALRVQALLRDIEQLPQKSIALATHGGIIRVLLAHIGGAPLADALRWEVAYGAVLAVKYGTR